ncbi:MAG: hypothetical protein COC23_08025 [Hyphomicrobiales bacterium]|nr:MAG: hypothetical protein COC23_08025 [Hyphomicrobiales bacterium]
MKIVEFPFSCLLYLTVLPSVQEQYSRLRCIIYPIPGLFFIYYLFHPELDMNYIYYVLPLGMVLTIVMAVSLPSDSQADF